MVLRTLATIGPLHAYAIATRLEQVSENHLTLNQGTLYPSSCPFGEVRVDQIGLGQDPEQPGTPTITASPKLD